ncbi:polysaccharide deacetylase family protein [Rhizobium sp. RAF56]|jgi:peptidoglycan/xylan/chitin deacetylase (PgdA/CDA1 family)|uniref:polysaccharide deacetylase family protein n=1 Tax=Rhizobium sp. RAF56 TaxID=3233062 RepID=UPI003F9AC65F
MNRFLPTFAWLVASAPVAFAAGSSAEALSPPLSPQSVVAPRTPSVKLVEPHLHVTRASKKAAPRVALTFDACMGKTDMRILDTLVNERVPATIFVTARWLRSNPQVLPILAQHPDLFEIENHGLNHIPAVDRPVPVYGIPAAGSPEAVATEVKGGGDAILAHGFSQSHWFRGATAKYSLTSIAEIRGLGYRIAGYSVNGDSGATLPAAVVERQYTSAKDGDVIISHINQPGRPAGEGVAKGILALKAKGVQFVRLEDIDERGDDDTTQ